MTKDKSQLSKLMESYAQAANSLQPTSIRKLYEMSKTRPGEYYDPWFETPEEKRKLQNRGIRSLHGVAGKKYQHDSMLSNSNPELDAFFDEVENKYPVFNKDTIENAEDYPEASLLDFKEKYESGKYRWLFKEIHDNRDTTGEDVSDGIAKFERKGWQVYCSANTLDQDVDAVIFYRPK